MAHLKHSISLIAALCLGSLLPFSVTHHVYAQAPAAAPAAARQLGTVKSVSADTLTLATDSGQTVTVTVSPDTKVLKLPAGSTDLKTAEASQMSDVAVGDRVLATGKAGDNPTSLTASRLILMKSTDIAEKNAADQAQWRTNGAGGIVNAVDPATGTITITSGTNKITITTSNKTSFKRFSGDSVKYQDAKPGSLAEIHVGDQLQARGAKSPDGLNVKADEVLSGSFKNLSGLIITADASAGSITLKDLATKKIMTVLVTPNTNIRKMPPQMAQMLAGRAQGGGRPGEQSGGAGRAASGGSQAGGGNGSYGAGRSGEGGGAQGGPGAGGGMRRGGGGDMAQMLNRLPTASIGDLTKGEAVMVVATEPTPGATTVSAITLLTGVEPILTANPNGGVDLGGWNMGQAPGAE
jgi:co-chaperonin GroES (HSP10)